MIYPGLVTVFALFVYIWMAGNVSAAHKRFGVPIPATAGNPDFDRYNRAHLNTLEQLVIFLPALWTCAFFLNPYIAAWLGLGWVIGRIFFALGYYKSAEKRYPGFFISFGCSIALLLCTLWGIGARLLIQ